MDLNKYKWMLIGIGVSLIGGILMIVGVWLNIFMPIIIIGGIALVAGVIIFAVSAAKHDDAMRAQLRK